MAVRCQLVNADEVAVCDEFDRIGIEKREICAENQGAASHRPECEHGALFDRGETGLARPRADIRVGPEFSEWEHVCIWPRTRVSVWSPCSSGIELALDAARKGSIALPDVPDIIRNAPQLRERGDF